MSDYSKLDPVVQEGNEEGIFSKGDSVLGKEIRGHLMSDSSPFKNMNRK